MGDQRAAEVVQPHLIELRKLLKEFCNSAYASEINEFAPIARIDGDIWSWNFEGCQKLRLSKKDKYITVDIGMPKREWDGVADLGIRTYLLENLKRALIIMVNKLKKEKYLVSDQKLFDDFSKIEKMFLGDQGGRP